MGVDVEIYIEAEPDWEECEDSFTAWVDYDLVPKPLNSDHMRPRKATHGTSSFFRYYSEDYARGPWPAICEALLVLMANPKVKRVWYGSDHHDQPEKMTEERLIELTRFWIRNGDRPYREGNT